LDRRSELEAGLPDCFGTTYQNGEKYTKMTTKYTKWSMNIFNGSKIDQMAKTFTNIFHFKKLQNLPKLAFLV
jgi:hypothetical protein